MLCTAGGILALSSVEILEVKMGVVDSVEARGSMVDGIEVGSTANKTRAFLCARCT